MGVNSGDRFAKFELGVPKVGDKGRVTQVFILQPTAALFQKILWERYVHSLISGLSLFSTIGLLSSK